ncbi:uncharacterized protein LOC105013078 isoform X1 [Esox lucius]|uniref:uncharacterized protein LOC105013078 isoform X1 n=1 Tax=Esox lucius TaxID=8010 RepID=UPI000661EFFE|nr:uncharacterized protein LOC105013078 isoform X1 [Esox lucius]
MFLFQVALLTSVLQLYQTYQACTVVNISCNTLKNKDGEYMYQFNMSRALEIEVYNNTQALIAIVERDKLIEYSREVIGMNTSSILLSNCQSLIIKFIISATKKPGIVAITRPTKIKEICFHYVVTDIRKEVGTSAPFNFTEIQDRDNPDTNTGYTNLKWIVPVLVVLLVFFLVYLCRRDKERVDVTKELTSDAQSSERPTMNEAGALLSHRDGPCSSAEEVNCSGEQAGPGPI